MLLTESDGVLLTESDGVPDGDGEGLGEGQLALTESNVTL